METFIPFIGEKIMIKSETLAKLAPALVKAQKNMGAAMKDSKNPFFKSKYADLNAIIDASIPALNEQGIAVLQSPGLQDGASVINTILLHESGEFIAGQSRVVAKSSNNPQDEGSATTYARRYGLQAMVTLKAEDDDGEAAMGRKAPEAPKPVQKVETPKKVEIAEKMADAAGSPENLPPATSKRGGWGKKAPVAPSGGDLY